MNIKVYCISIFLVLFSLNVFSQNKCDVKFANGNTMKGIIYPHTLTGPDAKKKIKIYDEKKKNPKKFTIEEIDEITVFPRKAELKYIEKLIRENPEFAANGAIKTFSTYKVIYGHSDKKRIPYMCIRLYKGKNFEFYDYNGSKNYSKSSYQLTFITKPNSNALLYSYRNSNKKNSLERLTKCFEGCSEFTKESKKKKAHKEHPIFYFYKLTDKCTDFKS